MNRRNKIWLLKNNKVYFNYFRENIRINLIAYFGWINGKIRKKIKLSGCWWWVHVINKNLKNRELFNNLFIKIKSLKIYLFKNIFNLYKLK